MGRNFREEISQSKSGPLVAAEEFITKLALLQDDENEAATLTHDRSFPWYHKAPDTGVTELTLFGQVHTALDELATEAAVRYCAGQQAALDSEMEDRQTQVTISAPKLWRCSI